MLPQHVNAEGSARLQARGESAGRYDILAEIGDVEEARIAFEHTKGVEPRKRGGRRGGWQEFAFR